MQTKSKTHACSISSTSPSRFTDSEIVLRVRAGDREAYSSLVSRYQNAVYGIAYHYLQDFEDARDAAQEALIQAYIRLADLREPSKFPSWLRQVTVNVCRHRWKHRPPAMFELDAPGTDVLRAPEAAIPGLSGLILQEVLGVLSDDSRITLILFHVHGYSYEEIAVFLEMPITTIKSRLRNARARLRKEMDMSDLTTTLKNAVEKLPADFTVKVMQTIQATGDVHNINFSPDGSLVVLENYVIEGEGTASPVKRGTVEIREADGGKILHTLSMVNPGLLICPTFVPDGNMLVCAHWQPGRQFNTLQTWDVNTASLLREICTPGMATKYVAVSPNGQTLAAGLFPIHDSSDNRSGCSVGVWDISTGEAQQTFDVPGDFIFCVSFSPDGRTLAGGYGTWHAGDSSAKGHWNNGEVRLWDLDSGELKFVLERPNAVAQSQIVFSSDGTLVATGDGTNGEVRVWDTATGELLQTLNGHTDVVVALAFSATEEFLFATAGRDGDVRFWDARSGQLLHTLKGDGHPITAIAFAPDGRRLATANFDRNVKYWHLE